jgi:hypothetical protein
MYLMNKLMSHYPHQKKFRDNQIVKKEAATFLLPPRREKEETPRHLFMKKSDAGFGAFHLIYIILQKSILQVNAILPNS